MNIKIIYHNYNFELLSLMMHLHTNDILVKVLKLGRSIST